jgi:hypothetical protein
VKFQILAASIVAALAPCANAAEIVRLANPPPAIILSAVIVPANAEILQLSGQLAAPIDATKPITGPDSFGDTKTQTISIFNKSRRSWKNRAIRWLTSTS